MNNSALWQKNKKSHQNHIILGPSDFESLMELFFWQWMNGDFKVMSNLNYLMQGALKES